MARFLSMPAIKLIERAVDQLFDKAKARYLGPQSLPKRIYIGFRPEFSLPGIFNNAAREERAIPDQKLLESLIQNAGNYIDAYRASTKANVVKRVQSFLQQAEHSGVDTNLETVLGGELADVWGKATSDIKRLIDTEATGARNLGTLEGIVSVNASEGIEDPVVFFVVVRDQHLCAECKRLHLLDDETTPRLWYLSELGHGYHKRGQSTPKVNGLHPHCRCTMVTLMPGYGFDAGGMVQFKSLKHDEMAAQRQIKKGEEEALAKSLPKGIRTYKRLLPKMQANAAGSSRTVPDHLNRFWQDLQEAPTTINLPSTALEDLAKKGRFRNLFETGTGLGETDKGFRANEEHRVFGIPHEMDDYTDFGYRPIYGALHYMHDHDGFHRQGAAPSYGDVWVQLKPHVRQRTTFTPDDSFSASPDEVFGYDHLEPLGGSFIDGSPRVQKHFSGEKPFEIGEQPGYIEAQIHGGVHLGRDVEELHLSPLVYDQPTSDRIEKLEKTAAAMGRKHGFKVVAHRPTIWNEPKRPPPLRTGTYTPGPEDVKAAEAVTRFWSDKRKFHSQQIKTAETKVLYDPAWEPKPAPASTSASPPAPSAAPPAAAPGAGSRTSEPTP